MFKKTLLAAAASAGAWLPLPGYADPLCDQFLSAQGSTNPGVFFAPVADYVGFGDAVDPDTGLPTTFALIDYAGLANAYIDGENAEEGLDTRVRCAATATYRRNSPRTIRVELSTKQALGFAQSIADLVANDFNFLATPTIFGAKAQDVVAGADPAAGYVNLEVSFAVLPGRPLPDLLPVVYNPCAYDPISFEVNALIIGKTADGGNAALVVSQKGKDACPEKTDGLAFDREIIKILPLGDGH